MDRAPPSSHVKAAGPAQNQRSQRSGGRPQLSCEHFSTCSGCALERRLSWGSVASHARATFAQMGVPFQVAEGRAHGWRVRARLAVRRSAATGKPAVGLFRRGSHEVVDIVPGCAVHHPRINRVAEALRGVLVSERVEPYDEGTGAGALRYVQLTAVPWENVRRKTRGPARTWETEAGGDVRAASDVASEDCSVELVLVWNADPSDAASAGKLASLCEAIWATMGPQDAGQDPAPLVCSVWANFQTARSNTIFGEHFEHMAGCDMTCYDVGGGGARGVFFHPGAFMQANHEMAARAVRDIRHAVAGATSVLDVYAGVGSLGLSVAPPGSRLVCVEVSPAALPPFQRSRPGVAEKAGVDASLVVCPAAEQLGPLVQGGARGPGEPWGTVLVDPPRKGLDRTSLAALCDARVAKGGVLAYLSCGFPALERDMAALLSHGWRVRSAQGYLFFPGADHLETLVVFDHV